ncbi:MAG: CAP domain-containing protein [Planctomycetes bacterium]|nr:CAP domain-containing protein [Planctomycetota bacterium]
MLRTRTILTILLLALPAVCQDDEARFNAQQAEELNDFAKRAFDKGFPRQARLIWLQVLKLYDPDNEAAHKALGHVRVGGSWAPDPEFEYPLDDTGSGKDGQALFKAYEKLRETLARAHKRQAQTWAKADRLDRALYHWRMVLRWDKDDRDAQAALEHREVGGVTGTALESTLYENSKKIEAAVAEQSDVSYPVEPHTAKAPVLDTAQVQYVSFRSEHFVLHGDPDQAEFLKEALVWAERTLRVAQVAFPWRTEVRGEFAFFVSKDTYKQILRAHADRVPDLAWKLENTTTSGVGNLVVGATGSVQVLYDAMVRNVAQAYAGFRTTGFREGIGHTFVGMMFNNNRLFAVDLKKQEGTTASEEDREYTSPDFDIWKTLALEMAWKETGNVPAIDIPYCEAATFTNEQRIKAWSFTDYVMRRDPNLLRELDALGAAAMESKRKQPLELAAKFEEKTGVSIAQLDKEWEDFWTEATPVLAAIRDNTPPLQAVSPNVDKWLAAFNEARKKVGSTPVTWSSNLSTRCYEHANYLLANKDARGPAAEHTEDVALGGTHLGAMFAQMAVVETRARLNKAEDMFDEWLLIPGYRDALLNFASRTVGIYEEKGVLVINTVAGLGEPLSRKAGYFCWPRTQERGIPTDVEVALIGPELEALLAEHGRAGQKKVGYPLTAHFGINVIGDRQSYRCTVTARGEKVDGALLLDSGINRRSTAPGMVTFYPFEPLPHGQIDVTWTWEIDGEVRQMSASFTTK